MPSIIDKNILPEFDSIKDDDEAILWSGKPKFIPYAMTALGLGLGVLIFVGFYYMMAKNINTANGASDNFSIWFVALPVVLFLFSFLTKLASYSNTSYAFSNKRIMIRSGFVGTDFKIIDYDKISDIEVSVNFIERAFNVGTIKFYSGRTELNEGITSKIYDRWEAIANPYKVFKQLKTVSVDIKTDFNYPNALRPDNNPGYNTKYNPKKST